MKVSVRRLLTGLLCAALLCSDIMTEKVYASTYGPVSDADEMAAQKAGSMEGNGEESAEGENQRDQLEQDDAGENKEGDLDTGKEENQENGDQTNSDTGENTGDSSDVESDTEDNGSADDSTESGNETETGTGDNNETESEIEDDEIESDAAQEEPEDMHRATATDEWDIVTSDDDIASGNVGTTLRWVINASGELTVAGTGEISERAGTGRAPWSGYRAQITSARICVSNIRDTSYFFYDCRSMTNVDMSAFDTSEVTNMKRMFYNCRSLTDLDISRFDTSKVTNMESMFYYCMNMTGLDGGTLDTTNVTDTSDMFYYCPKLERLDTSGFHTSNVADMHGMFWDCSSLTTLDVSHFNTQNVTDMNGMFNNCSKLSTLDVSRFQTGRVTDMSVMFSGCKALTSLDVSNFDTSKVTAMNGMFSDCGLLTDLDVSHFVTDQVTNMAVMFKSCSKLPVLDVSRFDTHRVTDMERMFYGCQNVESLDVSGFDTSSVINISGMFAHCVKVTELDVSGFSTGNVTMGMGQMFENCSGLTSLDLSGFNTRSVKGMAYMFSGCTNLVSLDLSSFDTAQVIGTGMNGMFENCSSLTSLDLRNFNTENVKNMASMFSGCVNLTDLDISNFNTANITNMYEMFANCSKLTELDVKSFDTAQVKDMWSMFDGCSSLISLDLSSFDLSALETVNEGMLRNCTALNRINTPRNYNCSVSIELPKESADDKWYDITGALHTELPGNRTDSIPIARNEIPEMPGPVGGTWMGIDWEINEGKLMISGVGAIPDLKSDERAPWHDYSKKIESIEIQNGITKTGEYSFYGLPKVSEVKLPDSLLEIGGYSFGNCPSLKNIKIARSVTSIGEYFINDRCKEMKIIYYDGTRDDWERIEIRGKDSYDALAKRYDLAIHFNDNTVSGYLKYVKAECEDKSSQSDYECDFSWFFRDSAEYNHELAKMSLKTEMAAFGLKNGTNRSRNITNLMDRLGFRYTQGKDEPSVNYPAWNQNDYETIGYAIGSREIESNGEKATLILVAIRGAGYGYEWGSNLNVGSSNETAHRGFDLAAEKVMSAVNNYITMNKASMSDEIRIWTVGYSRGAATANLFAAKICDGRLTEAGIDGSDLFAYTFECPQNTTDSSYASAKYKSIHNIVNPMDLIPMVAPTYGWGFHRYGMTYCLPSQNNTQQFGEFKKEVQERYRDLLDKEDVSEYFAYLNNQEDAFLYLVHGIVDLIGGRGDYCILYQEDMMRTAADIMVKSPSDTTIVSDNTEDPYVDILSELLILADANGGTSKTIKNAVASIINIKQSAGNLDLDKIKGMIAYTHYPELTLAWMEVLNRENVINPKKNVKTIYNCPVDIEVRDSNNRLAAQFKDDEAVSIEDGLSAYVDLNDQKIVEIPSDGNYIITVIPREDGNFTCTTETYHAGEILPESLDSYFELPITENQEYILKISDGVVNLENSLGQNISPDLSLGEDIDRYSISVTSVGDGTCSYISSALPGEYVKVTANPLRSSEDFVGWYKAGAAEDDEPLSMELAYRFLVTGNVSLEARFKDISGQMWVSGVNEDGYEYTGSAIRPEVEVYDGTTLLTEKVDYTISYSNNTKAFIYKESDEEFADQKKKAPTITIKGRGNYSGKETVYFNIIPKNIGDEDVAAADIMPAPFTKKNQMPMPLVTWGKKKLVKKTDYVTSYYSDEECTMNVIPKESGTYYVKVSGKGNYCGDRILPFVIIDNTQKLVSKLSVGKIKDKAYTGLPIELTSAEFVVKDGSNVLTAGKDYTVTYPDNHTDIGTVTLSVNGDGVTYIGSRSVSFRITGIALGKANMTGFKPTLPYAEGSAVNQNVSFMYGGVLLTGVSSSEYAEMADGDVKRSYDYIYEYADNTNPGKAVVIYTGVNRFSGSIKKTYSISGTALGKVDMDSLITSFTYDGSAKTQDSLKLTYNGLEIKGALKSEYERLSTESQLEFGYTIEYQNNIEAGTAKMMLTGVNAYTGSVTKTYKIKRFDISKDDSDIFKITLNDSVAAYSKAGAKPEPVVTFAGRTLKKGTDYTVKWANNTAINDGTGDRKPTVTVTGKGNFSGTDKTTNFAVSQRSIDDGSIRISVPDKVYSSRKGAWKSSVKVTDADGKKLLAGKDYEKVLVYTYKDSGDWVSDNDIVPAGTVIVVTITGKDKYAGSISGEYRVVAKDINKIKASVDPKTYTGKEVKLSGNDIIFKSGKTFLTDVTYIIDESTYKNNLKKGRATVVIRGTGDYGGAKTITYTIGAKGFLWWWRNLSN